MANKRATACLNNLPALPKRAANQIIEKPLTDNLADLPRENPNNILITEDVINNLFREFGLNYKLKDISHYRKAFVDSSYLIDPEKPEPHVEGCIPLQPCSYERLEYIGDAILNAAMAHYVFYRYPTEDEGFMTILRTKLVRSKTLARLTRKLKLHKYILLSQYADQHCNDRNNRSTLEDVFEAFIGALYMDCGSRTGFEICLQFITNVVERFIDIVTLIDRDDNYKKNLLEFYQKNFRTEAKYQIISVRGTKPNLIYTMGALSPEGKIIGMGQSRMKVNADQMASKQALMYYGQEVEESEEDSMSE